MDILPLKYVQITKRGLRIMHFLVYYCRFVGSDHVSLGGQYPHKAINMKKYVVYLPLKIVWHICERPPCEKIMIYSRRCNKTCTAHIQILKKRYFLPFL